jgi:hypothetical protein
MATTNYTTENLAALDSAIASGALEVKYGDKAVKYRSLAEMLQIKKLMMAELGISNNNNGRTFGSVDKGFR